MDFGLILFLKLVSMFRSLDKNLMQVTATRLWVVGLLHIMYH